MSEARDNLSFAMFAAWINCPPDKAPPEFKSWTCEQTRVAWGRVAQAAKDHHRAEVEAAVKRAIEACARRIEPHPDHDKADWSEYAWEKHRNAIYIRAIATDPEAIAKIIQGDA